MQQAGVSGVPVLLLQTGGRAAVVNGHLLYGDKAALLAEIARLRGALT